MTNYIKYIFGFLTLGLTNINQIFAENKGLLEGIVDRTENGVTITGEERIRTGDIHLDDIPNVIFYMIQIFIGMAGTVSVLFVILGAYKILFGSFKGDHTKGRDTIVMALTGFGISVLAWFIVKLIFSNFS